MRNGPSCARWSWSCVLAVAALLSERARLAAGGRLVVALAAAAVAADVATFAAAPDPDLGRADGPDDGDGAARPRRRRWAIGAVATGVEAAREPRAVRVAASTTWRSSRCWDWQAA